MKAVDKRPDYVGVTSLSVFGGNFILAKVRWGLICVRCLELRGVHFSEVRNVLLLLLLLLLLLPHITIGPYKTYTNR